MGPFLLDGSEYLVKMCNDLDFLANKDINCFFERYGRFYRCDPLFLKRDMGLHPNEKRAAVAASLIIMDAVARREIADSTHGSGLSIRLDIGSTKQAAKMSRKSGQNLHLHPLDPSYTGRPQVVSLDAGATRPDSSEMSSNRFVQNLMEQYQSSKDSEEDWAQPALLRNMFEGKKTRYRKRELLGEGSFAVVFTCERQDGKQFAVKCFKPLASTIALREYYHKCQKREISFLRRAYTFSPAYFLIIEEVSYHQVSSLHCTVHSHTIFTSLHCSLITPFSLHCTVHSHTIFTSLHCSLTHHQVCSSPPLTSYE